MHMLEKLPESVGEALLGQRAGLQQTVFHRIGANATAAVRIEVASLAFGAGHPIPVKYTADGDGVSPPLEWHGVPSQAAGVAVIVEDADSPTPHPLVHAIVVNLETVENHLIEGALNSPGHQGVGLQTGRNSFLAHAWLPPDPPPGHGVHRYVFQVFALGAGAAFSQSPGRQELIDAIEQRAIGAGYLIGTYERTERIKVQAHSAAEPLVGDSTGLTVPA
jgi:Raf kinase inhibitor-like YbhB/YbcL family protein